MNKSLKDEGHVAQLTVANLSILCKRWWRASHCGPKPLLCSNWHLTILATYLTILMVRSFRSCSHIAIRSDTSTRLGTSSRCDRDKYLSNFGLMRMKNFSYRFRSSCRSRFFEKKSSHTSSPSYVRTRTCVCRSERVQLHNQLAKKNRQENERKR